LTETSRALKYPLLIWVMDNISALAGGIKDSVLEALHIRGIKPQKNEQTAAEGIKRGYIVRRRPGTAGYMAYSG
jgi:hypothetical protein